MTDLSKIANLPNLKEVHAGNNNISSLSKDLLNLYGLKTLILVGNPICKTHPDLVQIENDQAKLKSALEAYFSGGPSPAFLQSRPDLGSSVGATSQHKGSFLGGDINDPSSLRKRIADLEKENEELKKGGGVSSNPYASTNSQTMRAGGGGADWMKFNQGFERPTTAS